MQITREQIQEEGVGGGRAKRTEALPPLMRCSVLLAALIVSCARCSGTSTPNEASAIPIPSCPGPRRSDTTPSHIYFDNETPRRKHLFVGGRWLHEDMLAGHGRLQLALCTEEAPGRPGSLGSGEDLRTVRTESLTQGWSADR